MLTVSDEGAKVPAYDAVPCRALAFVKLVDVSVRVFEGVSAIAHD